MTTSEPEVIYTVTAMKFDPKTGGIKHIRVWGWYPTKKLAFKSGFIGDDECGHYTSWLVEKVPAGFPICRERWWFRKVKGKVVLMPDPKCYEHIFNFSIG